MFNAPSPPQVSRWFRKNKSCDAACIAPVPSLIDWLIDSSFSTLFFLSPPFIPVPVAVELINWHLRCSGQEVGGVPFIGAFLLDDSSSHRCIWVCVASFAPASLWPLTGKNTLAWPFCAFILFFHCASFNSALIEENLLEAANQTLHCRPLLPCPAPSDSSS